MTKEYKNILVIVSVLALIALGALLAVSGLKVGNASSPSGLQATVASTSLSVITAGGTSILFATSSCSARIVSTATSSIMLTFSDYIGQTPTNTLGHWQGASTTVAYDSGQYGCGLVKAWSQSTQAMTVTEVR